jgi:hypothetical protein
MQVIHMEWGGVRGCCWGTIINHSYNRKNPRPERKFSRPTMHTHVQRPAINWSTSFSKKKKKPKEKRKVEKVSYSGAGRHLINLITALARGFLHENKKTKKNEREEQSHVFNPETDRAAHKNNQFNLCYDL